MRRGGAVKETCGAPPTFLSMPLHPEKVTRVHNNVGSLDPSRLWLLNDQGSGGRSRNRPRLALKPFPACSVARNLRRQYFDRNVATQPRVPRAIDLPHPARPKLRNDLVWPEFSARAQCHSGVDYTRPNRWLAISLVFANERRIPPVNTPIHESGWRRPSGWPETTWT